MNSLLLKTVSALGALAMLTASAHAARTAPTVNLEDPTPVVVTTEVDKEIVSPT
jgi:hypothetical protein